MTDVFRPCVVLVTGILLAMSLCTPAALALGTTAYTPDTYDIRGGYDACQHQRVKMGGEERLELVLVGFVGWIDGEPTAQSVLHLTSFEPVANPCNTGTEAQGTIDLEQIAVSGTGVFVV